MAQNTTSTLTTTIKEYYDRKLLETAQTKLCYQLYGQKRSIPRNSGKTIEFRRYNLFAVDAAALELTEGVSPSPQLLSQATVTATVKQYGAYCEITDFLDLIAIDAPAREAVILLGEQLGVCIEHVTRDAMLAGASIQYAGGNTSTYGIDNADEFNVDEAMIAALTLENSKARKFTDGGDHFKCIISPSQAYDLRKDSMWKDMAIYVDPERSKSGVIGRVLGVEYIVSTEAKKDTQAVKNAVNATVTAYAFVLKNTPSAAGVAYLVAGNTLMIGADLANLVEYEIASYVAGTKTVTLTTSQLITANHLVFSNEVGAPNATAADGTCYPIHHALMFGADAYGVIDIGGDTGTVKTIIHPPQDALEQVSTVAAKVMAYAAKVLNSLWIIDIQTGITR